MAPQGGHALLRTNRRTFAKQAAWHHQVPSFLHWLPPRALRHPTWAHNDALFRVCRAHARSTTQHLSARCRCWRARRGCPWTRCAARSCCQAGPAATPPSRPTSCACTTTSPPSPVRCRPCECLYRHPQARCCRAGEYGATPFQASTDARCGNAWVGRAMPLKAFIVHRSGWAQWRAFLGWYQSRE